MTEIPQEEREIFICGSGGKTISYPATTITELNPEKPVREFALPPIIHLAAVYLKGALAYSPFLITYFFSFKKDIYSFLVELWFMGIATVE